MAAVEKSMQVDVSTGVCTIGEGWVEHNVTGCSELWFDISLGHSNQIFSSGASANSSSHARISLGSQPSSHQAGLWRTSSTAQ